MLLESGAQSRHCCKISLVYEKQKASLQRDLPRQATGLSGLDSIIQLLFVASLEKILDQSFSFLISLYFLGQSGQR